MYPVQKCLEGQCKKMFFHFGSDYVILHLVSPAPPLIALMCHILSTVQPRTCSAMIAPLIPTSTPHPAVRPSQERRGLRGLRGQRSPRRNEPRDAALCRMAPGVLQRAADRWESPATRLSPPHPARRSVMDKYLQSHD